MCFYKNKYNHLLALHSLYEFDCPSWFKKQMLQFYWDWNFIWLFFNNLSRLLLLLIFFIFLSMWKYGYQISVQQLGFISVSLFTLENVWMKKYKVFPKDLYFNFRLLFCRYEKSLLLEVVYIVSWWWGARSYLFSILASYNRLKNS